MTAQVEPRRKDVVSKRSARKRSKTEKPRGKRARLSRIADELLRLINDRDLPGDLAESLYHEVADFVDMHSTVGDDTLQVKFVSACMDVEQAERSPETERLYKNIRLNKMITDRYEREPETLEFLAAVVKAKFSPNEPETQARFISYCLAEIEDNAFVPERLKQAIADSVMDLECSGDFATLLRRGAYVPALRAAK